MSSGALACNCGCETRARAGAADMLQGGCVEGGAVEEVRSDETLLGQEVHALQRVVHRRPPR
eukprot:3226767-Alexandrium_andersonii.AAC.1